jgi:hypothetical protein
MNGVVVIRSSKTDCRFEDKPVVQRLWAAISGQLQTCSDCVNAYHAAQVMMQPSHSAWTLVMSVT